jgi:hypothetical protein
VFVDQPGRSRWVTDTEVTQTITTDGHLKNSSVHKRRRQALIVLTMIRVLAFPSTQVFSHRQVRGHFRNGSFGFCDLAPRLAQFLLTPGPDSRRNALTMETFRARMRVASPFLFGLPRRFHAALFDDSFRPAEPPTPAYQGQHMQNQQTIRSQRPGLRNCWW